MFSVLFVSLQSFILKVFYVTNMHSCQQEIDSNSKNFIFLDLGLFFEDKKVDN